MFEFDYCVGCSVMEWLTPIILMGNVIMCRFCYRPSLSPTHVFPRACVSCERGSMGCTQVYLPESSKKLCIVNLRSWLKFTNWFECYDSGFLFYSDVYCFVHSIALSFVTCRSKFPMVLVANNSDSEMRVISAAEGMELASELKVGLSMTWILPYTFFLSLSPSLS